MAESHQLDKPYKINFFRMSDMMLDTAMLLYYNMLRSKRLWRNWHTRKTKDLVGKPLQVQVLSTAIDNPYLNQH